MILLLRCLGCGGGGGFGMTVWWKLRGKAIYQQGYNREAERQAIVVKTKRGGKNLATLPPAFDKTIGDSP